MTEADANVDDNQSYQEWTKAGAKQISNQIGEIHLQIVAKNKVAIPGGDGRVCRIVDGADGKKQQSRTNHLWLKEGKNARRVEIVTCQTRKEQKTWSTAPLKFEMPGPGKVTNIPAVAFSPSTCSKSCADLKKPLQKKLWRRRNLIIPSRTGEHINCILWLSTSVFSTLWIELTWEKCNCKKAKSKKKYLANDHLVSEEYKSRPKKGAKVLSDHVVT